MARSLLCTLILALSATALCWAEAPPRPEHPRPQMLRQEWLNLNGEWEFGVSDERESHRFLGKAAYPERIVVPFCRESKLSGLQHSGFVKNVWYRRTFEVPEDWQSPRVRLHVGACDWETEVFVNGASVGKHVGGNVAFAFDVTDALLGGENTVTIHAYDDTASGRQPLGKQSISGKSQGIFYTPTTGIWQTVWLEGVGESFIQEYSIDPDPERARALLNVRLNGSVTGLSIEARVLSGGGEVSVASLDAEWRNNDLALDVPNPRSWHPKDPFLYDLELTLKRGGEAVDQVTGYFGMRRVTIEGAAILINGEPVFQRLVLDQGFYPEGLWTAPSDEALRRDIELSQAAGFNGARLHQKVFEPRFLYWADRLGYLIWGEYPSFGANYGDTAVNEPIIREWIEIVQRDRNHPSIVGWCPFNETPPTARLLQHTAVHLTRRLDPSRPCLETSGWTHGMAGPEVLDAHDYDQNPESFRARWMDRFGASWTGTLPARYGFAENAHVPFFVSEYGGIGWSLDEKGWGYGNTPKSLEAFYERFKGLADAQLDNARLFGLCYTQLTDIEQEQNGVFNYDRSEKFDVAPLKAALMRSAAYETTPPTEAAAPAAKLNWQVLIGSRHDGEAAGTWSYTEKKPRAEWTTAGFDDARWSQGKAPFGLKGGWQGKMGTKWSSKNIWLRQDFECDGGAVDRAALIIHHDDDTEVFLNGQEIWTHGRWNDVYQAFDVTEKMKAAIKPGANTLAVHVHQDHGGQFLDLALLAGEEGSQ